MLQTQRPNSLPPKYQPSNIGLILLQKIMVYEYYFLKRIIAWNPFNIEYSEPQKNPFFYIFNDLGSSEQIAVFWPVKDNDKADTADQKGLTPFALALAMYKELTQNNPEFICNRLILPLGTANLGRAHWLAVDIHLNHNKLTRSIILDPKSKLAAKWYNLSYIKKTIECTFDFADEYDFTAKKAHYLGQQDWDNFVDCGPHIIEAIFQRLIVGSAIIDKEKKLSDQEIAEYRKQHQVFYNEALGNPFLPVDDIVKLNNVDKEEKYDEDTSEKEHKESTVFFIESIPEELTEKFSYYLVPKPEASFVKKVRERSFSFIAATKLSIFSTPSRSEISDDEIDDFKDLYDHKSESKQVKKFSKEESKDEDFVEIQRNNVSVSSSDEKSDNFPRENKQKIPALAHDELNDLKENFSEETGKNASSRTLRQSSF